jgi:DNA-directed RNA polymerase specialized sigma24 family protein
LALGDDQKDSPHRDPVKQSFNEACLAGNLALACGIYLEHVKARLCSFLMNRSFLMDLGLTRDDTADCADEAFTRVLAVLKTDPAAISNTYGYLFTAATTVASDLAEENRRHYAYSPDDEIPIPARQISPLWAEAVAFEAIEEAEPLASWALPAVSLALSRLPACQRKVLLAFAGGELGAGNPSFEPKAPEVAAHLGMNAAAVRQNKSRGLERLREEVRRAVRELAITLPPRLEEAVFPERLEDDEALSDDALIDDEK